MSTPIAELPYNTVSNTPAELPARDIPRETVSHTTDAQVKPNYIPPKQPEYIHQQQVNSYQPSKVDKLLEEFRLPIILSILYFIFQMPTVQAFIVRMIPSVVHNNELTMVGIMVKSVLFGLSYHATIMGMDYFQ